MKHGEGGDALVLEARAMLAAGQGEEEVFAELAARTGDWDACALALCLALGVPRPDAEARIHEERPLFDEFEAGEEDIVAMLLACGHTSVVVNGPAGASLSRGAGRAVFMPYRFMPYERLDSSLCPAPSGR
ncbi:hypothetical protein OHA37_07385 [Streptomyces sp. NBC_00335]|uniref:hypothetical protein n=1 Tax=unclassified Streptomyces TaxID=2593676 RepID=UPI002251260C|nr:MULTISPECIES: hypothetical protein [unclassified Streptomyces]MCX5403705.1 hypothetical protein [Streptomyces sp. NBC_00086]